MANARLFRQAGVFSLLGAATLMLALVCLVLALDSGRLFMEQRKLQKLADTAALETVARLEQASCAENSSGAAQVFAEENAGLNGFTSGTMTAECVTVNSENGINIVAVNPAGNAVQTTAAETVPASLILRTGTIFGFDFASTVDLQAQAVAERSSEPTAVFSIGAQLLRLENNKLLGNLLATVGLDVEDLTVLDSNGLANASITPAGLLKELGVKLSIPELKVLSPDELVELVNTEVGLVGIEQLIAASATLVGNHTVKADADTTALKTALLSEQLKNLQLNLLATETSSGLLSLASGRNGEMGAALDTQLTLKGILETAILTGVNGRAIHVPELDVLGAIKVELGIVEPPSLAVGPEGTTAYNAQVRLYADIDSDKLPIIGFLTKILGVRVHLPLAVDVVTAQAKFVSAQCHANPPTATFDVDSTLLNACIGNIPDELKWSGSKRCEQNLQETELIKLLNFPVLSGRAHIPGLSQTETVENLIVNNNPVFKENSEYFTAPNEDALGDTVDSIVTSLLDLLGGLFRPPYYVPGSEIKYEGNGNDKNKKIEDLAIFYLEKNVNKDGSYNIDKTIELIINGEKDATINGALLPPLTKNWMIKDIIPKKCPLLPLICSWEEGTFAEAFKSFSTPAGLISELLPVGIKGFTFCQSLTGTIFGNKNECIKNNLTKLLQEKPGGLDISHIDNDSDLFNPKTTTLGCSGFLCLALKPVISVLKPILNNVSELLTSVLLDETLGLELGRSALAVHDINCGAPRLVSMGSEEK